MRLREIHFIEHSWLVSLHNDPLVLKNLNDKQITLESHLSWWNHVKEDPKELRLIFTIDDKAAGFTKFYQIDSKNQRCLLGADMHPTHRGRGYAKFMWSLMLQKCFDELDMHYVGLRTAEYNEIGQRVYRSLGFKEEGRLRQSIMYEGNRYDDICMSILRPEWHS